ncbi:MAG: hypothetical protein QF645_03570 [Planctomycetota bacterium]|jgi:hypothetical protein|nr:hypothetical protein [Planctomycetota bacterium]
MKHQRKSLFLLILLAPLCLNGCQLFSYTAGILSSLLSAAVSIGGAVATYYLIKEIDN